LKGARYEYRVIVQYREVGRVITINRPENPFSDREQAEKFAARFTPPKFIKAWVEKRRVGKWEVL